MPVIRPRRAAQAAPPRTVPQRRLSHVEYAVESTDPVLAAQAEAAAVIVAAEVQRDRMLDEGYAEGRAQADAEIAVEQAALVAAIREIETLGERMSDALAASCAEIAVDIARSLIGDAVLVTPEIIAPLAARAIAEAPAGSTALRVHPSLASHIGATDLRIVPDPALAPGDVVIEAPSGELDARLDVIRDQLSDAVRTAEARR